MSSLKYWLWLSTIRTLGPARAGRLIDALGGPENVYFADGAEWLAAVPDISPAALSGLEDKSLDRADRILEMCERTGVTLTTMQDSLYPDRLRNLAAPPAVLYIKGKLPPIDEEAAIAVVGTRKPTPYGQNIALRMGYQLSRAGMLVISGMAKGIDGSAHIGALRAGRPTVAVLGCGPDVIYPSENKALYEDISAAGAIVSEYPPGTPVAAGHFPMRNRIISGLALGTLIVEAPKISGALITASLALEQGRDLYAVPGSVDSADSAGCHDLIREGATLVYAPEQIVSEYIHAFSHKLTAESPPVPAHMPKPAKPARDDGNRAAPTEQQAEAVDLTALVERFEPEQQRILLTIAGTPRIADEIISLTGLTARVVLSELTLLEIDGVVTALPGKRFVMSIDN